MKRAWMGSVVISLADHGQFLATRAKGQEIREHIEALTREESVILDWSGVEAITVSFGDELVGKLLSSYRKIGDVGMSAEVRETIETVCRRREALA